MKPMLYMRKINHEWQLLINGTWKVVAINAYGEFLRAGFIIHVNPVFNAIRRAAA